MKKIFITGVSGFVGSSLVHFFDGDDVKLYGHSRDKLKTQHQYQDLKIELVDAYSTETFNALGIDCIIHLAGIAHDLSNQYVEADYFRVNNQDTRTVYDAFLRSTVKKFIYLSSIKAAVDHHGEPIDESVAPNPITPYGRSKRQAEQYIESQALPAGKGYYILRPCMIHGPSNKGNLNLLYKFVKTGIPYPLGAFKNERSFLSADNLNFIINKLVNNPIESGVYHLADSESLPTTDVVQLIARTLNRKPKVWNLPPSLMRFAFSMYNKSILHKLTETMVVSNNKILNAMHSSLPCTAQEGLTKTIKAFDK